MDTDIMIFTDIRYFTFFVYFYGNISEKSLIYQ